MSLPNFRINTIIEEALIGKGSQAKYTHASVTDAVNKAVEEARINGIEEVIRTADELNERLAAVLRLKFCGV